MKIREMGARGLLLDEIAFAVKTEADMAIVERSGVVTMIYLLSEKAKVLFPARLSPCPKKVDSEAHDCVYVLPFKLDEAKKYLLDRFDSVSYC